MSKPVDMSREAITARIRGLSRLSKLDDPFRPRVDMSREAITVRIHELSELSRLCRSLDATAPRPSVRDSEPT